MVLARSLLLVGPRRLRWNETELADPEPDEIVVRTRAGAISIGSELPVYRGDARRSTAITYPRMSGYESLGIVVACGEGVRRLQAGDRVLAFYGHRTAAVVPESRAIAVPDAAPDALALLAILSCDAAKGVQKLRPWLDEPVLITGFGVMGALTLFVLRALGSAAVDVIEPRPERRVLASRLGARVALAPDELPRGEPAQYAAGFECSSRDSALALLQERLRPGGRICILADGNIEPLTLTPAFHEKELLIAGSSDGWDYHRHAAWFFERVLRAPSRLEELFDFETSADGLAATFEQLAAGAISPLKVLVRYQPPAV